MLSGRVRRHRLYFQCQVPRFAPVQQGIAPHPEDAPPSPATRVILTKLGAGEVYHTAFLLTVLEGRLQWHQYFRNISTLLAVYDVCCIFVCRLERVTGLGIGCPSGNRVSCTASCHLFADTDSWHSHAAPRREFRPAMGSDAWRGGGDVTPIRRKARVWAL